MSSSPPLSIDLSFVYFASKSSLVDRPKGLEGSRQPKVPTLVLYDDEDPTNFKWGGQIDWSTSAIRGVKLLLDPDQPRPAYLPISVKRDRKALPKDPIDVAADFIGAIYKHALTVIESSTVKGYFKLCEKDFILSVPAVWSDKAKDLTLQVSRILGLIVRQVQFDLLRDKAAKKAGIHPVTMIKEPEAAALHILSAHEHAFQAGDGFVVCDAGGGTVDLITYEILRVQPQLELVELVPGSGKYSHQVQTTLFPPPPSLPTKSQHSNHFKQLLTAFKVP